MPQDTAPRPSEPSPPRSAEDRVAVVVNGNAKAVTDDLVEILDQIVQSGDLFVSRSLEEGRDIARIIVERGYPTVVTGGGDGTFTQMVTFVVGEADRQDRPPPRFGMLRLGTGNALAWV
ncbi:MAG: diacylglycerol kinase family protein, partial [Polyangiales bacterium]